MATVSSTGKVAYIYDASGSGTWYPIAGSTNPAADISWTGNHSFATVTNFQLGINAKSGVNNFASTSARSDAIPSPVNGVLSFLRSDDSGVVNQLQYYYNGLWRTYGDNAGLSFKTTNIVLAQSDAGKTIDIESSTAVTVTIPLNATVPFLVGTQIAFIQTGAGQVSFVPDNGVTLLSKGPGASPTVAGNRKISARYSPATLIKRSENVWVLIGDLTA